jgi:hypothetical protein
MDFLRVIPEMIEIEPTYRRPKNEQNNAAESTDR